MTLSPRSAVLYSALFGSLLVLGACGKKEEQPAPAAASTAPAPAATTPAPASTAPAPAPTAPAAPATVAAPAPTATTTAAPAAAALSVAKVTLGSSVNPDHQVTHPSDHFTSDVKTIYAAVATEGQGTGAKLNAKWSYLGSPSQLVSSITQAISTDGPAITTFKVENPDLWPEGKYKVEVSLDGKVVADQSFEIAKR